MLEYSDEGPIEYSVGGNVSFGSDGVSGNVNTQVQSAGGASGTCLTCGGGIRGLTLPIILVGIAVLVLALRK